MMVINWGVSSFDDKNNNKFVIVNSFKVSSKN